MEAESHRGGEDAEEVSSDETATMMTVIYEVKDVGRRDPLEEYQ